MEEHPISADELAVLRRFCDVYDRIASCRFVAEFRQRSCPTMVGTLPDGTVVNQFPRYDHDDFLAFLTHYRLLVLEKERTNIFRVLNLLSRVGSEPEREELKGYKKNINTGASSWWGAKAKVEGNAEEVLLCSREVEDLLFNAEVFRTGTDSKKDEEKRRLWQQIEKYGPVWQHSFLRYAMTVVHYAYRLAESIRTKGYAEKCPAVAEYWAQPTHDLEEASGESRAATLPD